jgi:tRNA dimethylallyltransferase
MPPDSTPDARTDLLQGIPLCAILGPTAVGKSALALAVAERAGAEIVSLDSMQVYRGMDVGTAKPTPAERARVRHHMIDVVEPNERYDVQRFLRDLSPVMADARQRAVRVLFVGGTGFYLKILLSGLFDGPDVDAPLRAELMGRARSEGNAALHAELARVDPTAAARIHVNDTKRVVRGLEVFRQTGKPLSAWQIQWGAPSDGRATRRLVGLHVDSQELGRRIEARARAMLAAGFPEEAAGIRAHPGFGPTAVQALGYAEALELHDGAIDRECAVERITRATRRFARRQRTWYRKFEDIVWLAAPSVREDEGGAGEPLPTTVAEALRALGW